MIERLSIPRRDVVDINKYFHPLYENIGVQTKRGCPLKCAYCSYPFLNGTKLRLRSPQSVADEIEYLLKEFNIKKFMFVDSVFNVPKGHAEAICKEIIKRGLNVQWGAWFHIKDFTEELMTLAKEAGCNNMSFSPDAASDESLKALQKGITEADIYRVLGIVKKAKGIRFGFSFFCTPPKQDFKGFLKTVKLYFAIHLSLLGRGGASIGWIRVEPETRMHKMAIEEGVLREDDDLLPGDEKGLERLFYSCPATRWYADPVFNLISAMQAKIKPFVKKILGRKK